MKVAELYLWNNERMVTQMLSVIMLTYNRENFISNMIEDVLGQSFKDFEFIIIDNGSMDKSGKIADSYASKDERIKVVHLKEPQSIGYARNLGLKISKGEYVTYVDDDDRIKPDFLEFLYKLIKENKADISMSGTTEGDGQSINPQCIFDEKYVITGEEAVQLLLERKYIRAGIPAKLYKREILEKYPFVEHCKNEDIHTQYKYLLEANIVAIHGIDKYYIIRHTRNVSGFTSNASQWDMRIMKDYLTAFYNRTKYIEQKAPTMYELALYSEWAFMISMIDKIEKYQLQDCKMIEKRLKEILKANREKFLSMPELKDFEREWMERYIG